MLWNRLRSDFGWFVRLRSVEPTAHCQQIAHTMRWNRLRLWSTEMLLFTDSIGVTVTPQNPTSYRQ